MARVAQEESDLINVAWYKNADDANQIVEVLLESDIAALVEGSVLYSVEVRRRDADMAKTILRNDNRLNTLAITVEP